MKGTEKILARISSEAEAQAAEVLARAQEQCTAVREQYDARAKEIYDRKLAAAQKDAAEQADSAVRIAQMEARRDLLALKQEMVAAAFTRAEERLCALPPEEKTAFYAALVAQASSTGKEEIVLNEADRAAVGAAVTDRANAALAAAGKPAGVTLASESGSFSGGVMLRDGKIETNCTAELLLSLCRDELSGAVAQTLFED